MGGTTTPGLVSPMPSPSHAWNPSHSSPPYVGSSSSTSVFSLPMLSAPNLTNLVTITLSSPEDYLLWKTQITCLLLSHQLLGFVDGTVVIPSPTVLDDSGHIVPNVRFYEYLRVDQQVKSWIFATLSRDVFVDVRMFL